MLKEIVSYKENLPLNCMIINLQEYPIHFHNDLEIVFVLEGRVHLKNGYYNYRMKEGDIYILNDRELHSYYSLGDSNVVMLLQFNLAYFSRYYEALKNSFFVTDINEAHDKDIEDLQELLAHIALECLQEKKTHEERVINLAHNLIDRLFNDFQYFAMDDGRFINEPKNKGNKILAGRLKRTVEYMYENYNRRLTLAEIAEREHLSIYYMSHFIKESTGLSFQELLGFIRVEESEKLLLGTAKKIGDIAAESGFSAVRYYISYFTKWFGMHPADYRKKYKNKVRGKNTTVRFTTPREEKIRKLLLSYVDESFSQNAKISEDLVVAEVDTKEYLWVDEHFLEFFNVLIKQKRMRPVAEVLKTLYMGAENIVAAGKGYYVFEPLKNSDEDRKSYCLMLYNLEKSNESKEAGKQREYFLRFSGLEGAYTIARWKLIDAAFATDARKERGKKEEEDNHINALINSWKAMPEISIGKSEVSKVLGIKSQHEGNAVELVLIEPAFEF